jgi:cell division protein FtsB
LKPDEAPARPDSLRSVVIVAALCVLALLALAGVKSYRDLDAARGQERQLQTQIRQTGQRIARLRGRIERLRGDPVALENLAREQLGLVRPGDVVIVLPADGAPARPRAAPPALPNPPVAATPGPMPALPATLTPQAPPGLRH